MRSIFARGRSREEPRAVFDASLLSAGIYTLHVDSSEPGTTGEVLIEGDVVVEAPTFPESFPVDRRR